VNDASDVSTAATPVVLIDAALQRVRPGTESILPFARFFEAVMKQRRQWVRPARFKCGTRSWTVFDRGRAPSDRQGWMRRPDIVKGAEATAGEIVLALLPATTCCGRTLKTKNPRSVMLSRVSGIAVHAEKPHLVPTARLELAQLSPLPPQDSVSTNFTTSALQGAQF
jgi:hypothetical protein